MSYSARAIGNVVTYTPTVTGFSSTTTAQGSYTIEGKRCILSIDITGTSDATGFTFTLPFTADANIQTNLFMLDARGVDNGTAMADPALIRTRNGTSNIADVYKTLAGGAWTGSGTKGINGTLIYFIT